MAATEDVRPPARIRYSLQELKSLWSDSLQMPVEMRDNVDKSGILIETTDNRNSLRKHTESRIRRDMSKEIASIREACEQRDNQLKTLNSDSGLTKWSDLIYSQLHSAVEMYNFQPVSKLWSDVCALRDLNSDCGELKDLAQQCRSAFWPLVTSSRGASAIDRALNEELEDQKLEEAKQHRDCILFLGHLYVVGSLSVSAYCCMHRIALCELSDQGDGLQSWGLQETLEKLVEKVTRARHIVAYFCERDQTLNALVEDTELVKWSELVPKNLRSAVRNKVFQPESQCWSEVCNKIRLCPRPQGIDDLARQCREVFTRPEAELAQLEAGYYEVRRQQRDRILFVAYLIENEASLRTSSAFQCLIELMSWMLRSSDGNLAEWQQHLQESLDELMNNYSQSISFSHQNLSAEEKSALEPWEAAASKDTYFFYECPDLLNGYCRRHMPKKIKTFKISFEKQLKEQLAAANESDSFRVLSLGCGPGSELLAVMEVWAERSGGRCDFSCVGVDQYWWPKGAFLAHCCRISNPKGVMSRGLSSPQDSGASMKAVFVQQDMTEFVANARAKVDLAVLSFVGVGRESPETFFSQLKQLLTEDGAIFIIDNFVSGMLDLLNLGFHPTAVWMKQESAREGAEGKETPVESLYAAKVCLVYRKRKADSDEIFQVFRGIDLPYSFVTECGRMPDKMRLDAYISAANALRSHVGKADADQLVARDVASAFNDARKYSSCRWTCTLATEAGDSANQLELDEKRLFLRFRQSSSPIGPWLLIAEKNSDEECVAKKLIL